MCFIFIPHAEPRLYLVFGEILLWLFARFCDEERIKAILPPTGESDSSACVSLCVGPGLHVEGKAPVFSSALQGCAITEGQNIALQCSVEARPQPTISWLLNGTKLHHTCKIRRKKNQQDMALILRSLYTSRLLL